ncbi:MAG: bifunctional precorrin-2 dehydrogenase/sirohydrochlorin ferrochelatase [Desulfobacterales bacterium]|nr:bifunctional precorrin-2 dehydrogenase/sirohydrochlorin ferrochelatase [Desulfobacterales bacterium]
MKYYPVSLDLEGRRCLVIGGGRVAARKIRGIIACGARVTVVSPGLTPELAAMAAAGDLVWRQRSYGEGDLAGFFLVIAATDDQQVQEQVHEEAGRLGVLLNVADVPRYCNFILPATVRRGDLSVSISTGGKSPALARALRLELEKYLGDEYGLLVEILGELRPAVLAAGRSQQDNEKLFSRMVGQEVLAWIRANDWDRLEAHVRALLQEAGIDVAGIEKLRGLTTVRKQDEGRSDQ